MLNPRLASRYAKSLIDLSIERNEIEKVYEDMLVLQQIVKGNKDFVLLLKSPVITSDKKIKILEAVTKGKISELTSSFIRLLITKTREASLPEIVTAFISQYKKHKSIYTVKLTTATHISDALRNKIVSQIRENSEMQHIEIETAVKEDLIGGFVLQVGDKMIDASISYDLREISKQFDNNDFVYKVR